ncbi:MAG: Ig-like domain repeat protein [Rhodanobacteraceae bacterium]|nr:Ig-like domain repeat protein [Rhodanobacteraceae bacterium]
MTTGNVEVRQLSDGATCTIDLALGSSCSLTPTAALTTAVRAFYLGSGSLLPSQSAAQAYPVARADTAIQIVSDTPDPSGVGEPIQVTVSLGVVSPGAGTPTGEVLVTDGIASCGFALPNLGCELVPKALGAATLEARYAGDANFNASVDTESHTITVDGADLSISKFNGLRLVPGGVPSAYVLLVRNLGPQNVANARVTDILPPQLGNASWTCSAGSGASCPASGTGTVDALVSLNAGSSLTFTLTVTAQASPEQVVSNTATVTPPPNAPDPVPGNNSSTDVDPTGVFGEGFETEVE